MLFYQEKKNIFLSQTIISNKNVELRECYLVSPNRGWYKYCRDYYDCYREIIIYCFRSSDNILYGANTCWSPRLFWTRSRFYYQGKPSEKSLDLPRSEIVESGEVRKMHLARGIISKCKFSRFNSCLHRESNAIDIMTECGFHE